MISIEGCLSSSLGATNKSQQMHTERLEHEQETEPAAAALGRHRSSQQPTNDNDAAAQSTIAILRRHPMYDSLVLVKKYRPCLGGYTLEFPTSTNDTGEPTKNGEHNNQAQVSLSVKSSSVENDCILGKAYDVGCGRTKLVSVYLDGDDPIYQHKLTQQNSTTNGEQHDNGEVVYVPINGLLHRLNNYDRHGISIDSRVYAFAMGLKTAERFLTSSTEKEVQEAPPL